MSYFNIKQDNELIATSTHFWCQACVVARLLVEQSPDPRYCWGCYEVLKIEAEMQRTRRAAWIPKNMSHKTTPDATQTTPALQEVVSKLPTPIISPVTEKQVIMKQPTGRPRKAGEISRVTHWRRKKEAVQGVLV